MSSREVLGLLNQALQSVETNGAIDSELYRMIETSALEVRGSAAPDDVFLRRLWLRLFATDLTPELTRALKAALDGYLRGTLTQETIFHDLTRAGFRVVPRGTPQMAAEELVELTKSLAEREGWPWIEPLVSTNSKGVAILEWLNPNPDDRRVTIFINDQIELGYSLACWGEDGALEVEDGSLEWPYHKVLLAHLRRTYGEPSKGDPQRVAEAPGAKRVGRVSSTSQMTDAMFGNVGAFRPHRRASVNFREPNKPV